MSHTKRLRRELRTMPREEQARRLAGLEAAYAVERNALVRSSLWERIVMVRTALSRANAGARAPFGWEAIDDDRVAQVANELLGRGAP